MSVGGGKGTCWYRGYPVFTHYNLSSLRADHVTYHKRQRQIEVRIGSCWRMARGNRNASIEEEGFSGDSNSSASLFS